MPKEVPMKERVTINDRGVVTIPAALRRALGLKAGEELIAEDTPEGILLRPAVSVPIEVYTEERIAEFARDKEAIEKLLLDKIE
jgi:AbrB family looped-hinge helix DNA binding protein